MITLPKIRDDSFWSTLSVDQRQKISSWLYTDRKPYRQVRKLMQEQLDVICSLSAIATMSHFLDAIHGWHTNMRLEQDLRQPPLTRQELIALHLETRKTMLAIIQDPTDRTCKTGHDYQI